MSAKALIAAIAALAASLPTGAHATETTSADGSVVVGVKKFGIALMPGAVYTTDFDPDDYTTQPTRTGYEPRPTA
ncbi:hypothetical protein OG394_23485 [Kribbella sp. NBC_01245]|uniref:hypothetical protein n=1 Tax=Kribbella sp. NBC_01245 TaxID=2903578 RepID=UPI002E29D04D|nr:hypothetical protein [Kribbella sp. NBC_01245]